MNIAALRKRLSGLLDEQRALMKDGEVLTTEQRDRFDTLSTEIDDAQGTLERAVSLEQREADLAVSQRTAPAAEPTTELRARPEAGLPADSPEGFESLADFFRSAISRPNDPRLQDLYHESEQRSGQSMGVGAQGGFAVPEQFRAELMEVPPEAAVIESRAQVIPAGSPPDAAITMPALDQGSVNMEGGVEVEWIAEGAEKPETDMTLRQIKLEPQELAAHIPVTDKLLRNWVAASSVLERLLRNALLAARERAFVDGDGVGKPHGYQNSGCVLDVNRANANQVSYADIVAMEEKFFGTTGVWLASKRVIAQLRKIKDDEGAFIWQPNARDGAPPTMLGYPVIPYHRIPQLGNRGDLSLANFQSYLIKEGSGPFVEAGFSNNDFVRNRQRIKVYQNIDGQSWLTQPYKLDNGDTQSPFVLLDVPS